MDEVLAKAGIAKELQFAGILQVTGAFYRRGLGMALSDRQKARPLLRIRGDMEAYSHRGLAKDCTGQKR